MTELIQVKALVLATDAMIGLKHGIQVDVSINKGISNTKYTISELGIIRRAEAFMGGSELYAESHQSLPLNT